jgi:predicted amidohydrolase
MEFVATLVYNITKVKKILKEVNENSVVLFPESVKIPWYTVKYYSENKKLFIIYNDDSYVNGKYHITMKGVDKGKIKWMVHKYYLWEGDIGYWDPAPALNPIVKIRGRTVAVTICYEISKIAGYNKLYQIGKIIKKAKTEILLMPADWWFNFCMPQCALTSAFNNIPSLKVGVFSCRRELAFVSTKKERRKITKKGWVSIEI